MQWWLRCKAIFFIEIIDDSIIVDPPIRKIVIQLNGICKIKLMPISMIKSMNHNSLVHHRGLDVKNESYMWIHYISLERESCLCSILVYISILTILQSYHDRCGIKNVYIIFSIHESTVEKKSRIPHRECL